MEKKTNGSLWDDTGVAMITVLGVIAVITVLAVASFSFAQQALLDSKRVEHETKAFRAAASGLDTEMATFTEANLDVYPKTGSTEDGTYEITLVTSLEDPRLGADEYRLVSTGTSSDGVVERVAQQFYYMNLWKMNFAGGGLSDSLVSGANSFTGSSNVIGPFYMRNDFSISASMYVAEGPLFVKDGDIDYGQGMVGLEDEPVDLFCDGNTTALEAAAAKTSPRVFLGAISRSVPQIEIPEITQANLEEWANLAINESVDNNMGSISRGFVTNKETDTGSPAVYTTMFESSGYPRTQADPTNLNYKFIGAVDNSIANSGEGTHGLTIDATTSFGFRGSTNTTNGVTSNDAGSSLVAYPVGLYADNVHDDFAWDSIQKILFVEGTVFIDGPLVLDLDVEYIGNGTLVANGPITVNGLLRPAGTAVQARAREWALGLVTPTTITFTKDTPLGGGVSPNETDVNVIRDTKPDVGGAFYAGESVTIPEKLFMSGSVITDRIAGGQNNLWLVTNPYLPGYLPESLPGAGGGLMMPGLWTRF
ncbi:MAG: hypothetical protein Q7J82_04245 [Coriobacteriia bacterium]|nr:hypothetical protein [Coriobacteriia bacterium]